MKVLDGLRLDIGYNMDDIKSAIASRLGVHPNDIFKMEIIKEGLDARRKPNLYYNLNVAFESKSKNKKYNALPDIEVSHVGIEAQCVSNKGHRPIVVGFGPAGIFMALKLAKCGLKPIVIEQGDDVDARRQKIDYFWTKGKLDVYSNVHFGEGGAGTFSDGKLNSNISNYYCKIVTNELINHGAPKEIFYKSKPHIGTDNLKLVVKSIRQEIIGLGGEVRFGNRLIDIDIANGVVKGVIIEDVASRTTTHISCDTLILAIGHSAKPVFKILQSKGVIMEQKPFAMGVRIEQSQEDINMAQYGRLDSRLPAADYKLVEHLDSGRSVFTFCMCPGGEVVACSSEEGTIVTNGMSYFARNGSNANSALLVNIEPKDFGSDDVLAGFDCQSRYERLAYELGGGGYLAPAQTVGEFLGNRDIKPLAITYRPGIKLCNIRQCLPEFVSESIEAALPRFDRKIKNFAKDSNLLIAIESRSSCPVRIVRNEKLMTSVNGIFAVGEGAGYAGGIMSSAQDGLKVAEQVIEYIKEND